MRRTFFLLFLSCLVFVTGWGMQEQRALRQMSRDVEESARAVALAYAVIVNTELPPLIETGEVEALKAISDTMQGAYTTQERVRHIARMQLALWDIVRSAKDADAVLPLRKSIENHGAIAPLLVAYNAAVMRWNQAQEHSWQILNARLIGTEQQQQFPFLRFDGRQEWIPVIQI